ncbi:hypothetical protein ACFLYQ_04895 [Chloroflexota bacterium]
MVIKEIQKPARATDLLWDEVIAVCPGCKAIQNLLLVNGNMLATRKFMQLKNLVYHDCGSNEPCHIYRAS